MRRLVDELQQQVAAAKQERDRLEAEKKARAGAEAAQQREEEKARAAKAERQKELNKDLLCCVAGRTRCRQCGWSFQLVIPLVLHVGHGGQDENT